MAEVGLSLGCNVGQCVLTFRYVIAYLQYSGQLCKVSSLYVTEPWGTSNQPDYYNCVVVLRTLMPLPAFFRFIRELENRLGRESKGDYKPRTIDIDILFFGNTILQSTLLTIPHARMHLRRFVLEPLKEVYPEWEHPVLKQTAKDLLDGTSDDSKVVRLSPYPKWLYSSSING